MPLYESVFIARQDISSAQVDSLADQFTGLIQENGGEIKKREYWGLRNLAYRIKKNRKGHYVLFNIEAPAPAVHEMERNMRINEDVIRFLTVKVEELEEEPSAMMRSRGGRDERGGRRPGGRFGGHGGDGRGPRGGRDDEGRPPRAARESSDDSASAEGDKA
jgi:small subunit ribosomal protein S6